MARLFWEKFVNPKSGTFSLLKTRDELRWSRIERLLLFSELCWSCRTSIASVGVMFASHLVTVGEVYEVLEIIDNLRPCGDTVLDEALKSGIDADSGY